MSESEEPITVEITVACGLRILAGGTQPDQNIYLDYQKLKYTVCFAGFLLL